MRRPMGFRLPQPLLSVIILILEIEAGEDFKKMKCRK